MKVDNRADAAFTPSSLYELGEYSSCLILIGETPETTEEFILRLRCLIRTEAYHDVIRDAMRVEHVSDFHALEICTLLATACYRAKDERAERYFRMAYEIADIHGATEGQMAELWYYDALRKWSALEFDSADELVKPLLSMEHWRQKALELNAWTAFGRGDLKLHRELLRDALECKRFDIQSYATILYCYAQISQELYHPEDIEFIETHANAITWPHSDLNLQRFYTYQSLGWICALSGSMLKAYDYLSKAEQCVTSKPTLLATVMFDKAYLAFVDGETDTARENIQLALNAVRDLSFTNGSTMRLALLFVTIGCARLCDIENAQECWERYQAISIPITPAKAYGLGDRRLYALEQVAFASLARAKGNNDAALIAFGEAFKVWDEIGYLWRAALIKSYIAEISGNPSHLDYSVQMTDTHFPKAWFSKSLNAHRLRMPNPTFATLSDTKRAIILGLLRGEKYRTIGEQLGICEQTVTNHVQALYKKFKPAKRTRLALVARLRELGIK